MRQKVMLMGKHQTEMNDRATKLEQKRNNIISQTFSFAFVV